MFHAFLGEKLPGWKSAASLVKKIAENYKLPYYTMSPTYSICKNHGYINGEEYRCPECGETTEVYSRITGYYRPVQNWNDGKSQEFKDRKVYDLNRSNLHITSKSGEDIVEVPEHAAEEPQKILFTTKTCPNCTMAKSMLEKAHIDYVLVDAEEHADLVQKYGVKQAPTLIVIDENGVEKLANASNIKKYTEGH